MRRRLRTQMWAPNTTKRGWVKTAGEGSYSTTTSHTDEAAHVHVLFWFACFIHQDVERVEITFLFKHVRGIAASITPLTARERIFSE